MAFLPPRPATLALCCSALLLSVSLAGCADGRRSSYDHSPAETEGPPRPPAPDMAATGTFFAGQVGVDILLGSNGFSHRAANEKADSSDASDSGGGSSRGGSGGGRRARGSGGGGGRSAQGSSDDDEPTPHIRASNAPPVRLHLRLTNHGAEPVEVIVVDFNSDLGNFVVEPAKIAIAPNASAEAEPMISRLGVNADAIPVTVNLRMAGQSEKQVLTLRVEVPATPPPAAPSTPPTSPAPSTP